MIVPQELTVLITHILRGAKVVKIKIRIRCLNKRISGIKKPRCIGYRKISVIIEKGLSGKQPDRSAQNTSILKQEKQSKGYGALTVR